MVAYHDDQLRILLLDDNPFCVGADGIAEMLVPGSSREYGRELRRCFRLQWLRTPVEMREYFDLASAISARRARTTGELGVIPELLVFDFALTSTTARTIDDGIRGDSNPILPMRQAAAELGVRRDDIGGPLTAALARHHSPGEDRFGCFAGGLVSLQFADYACIGIPTTQYAQSGDTMFFEWFLERPLSGLFEKKSRGSVVEWPGLLADGLPALRNRLVERTSAGTVRVSVDTLLILARRDLEPAAWIDQHVCWRSKYGSRSIRLKALFFDLLFPDPRAKKLSPIDCSNEVREWATTCLDGVLVANAVGQRPALPDELVEAITVAERFQKCYLSAVFEERRRLSSTLFGASSHDPETVPPEVRVLAAKWGVSLETRDWKATVREDGRGGTMTLGTVVQESGGNPFIARLAALFCVVWAEGVARMESFGALLWALEQFLAEKGYTNLHELIEGFEGFKERLYTLLRETGGDEAIDELKFRLKSFQKAQGHEQDVETWIVEFIKQYREVFEELCIIAPRSVATSSLVYDILAPSPRRAVHWRECGGQTAAWESNRLTDDSDSLGQCTVRVCLRGREEKVFAVEGGSVIDALRKLKEAVQRSDCEVGIDLKKEEGTEARYLLVQGKKIGPEETIDIRVESLTDAAPALFFTEVRKPTGGTADYLNDVGAPLKRLHSPPPAPGGWGGLGLSISDVLNGRYDSDSHGLRPGEGTLLRLYADRLEFSEVVWPQWLRDAP